MISHPENVATPATAAIVTCAQPSVPPPFSATARVTLAVLVVLLPPESSMVATGWVVQVAVLPPPFGCVVKTTCEAEPTVMVKFPLVPFVRPGALAVNV